MFSPVLTKPDDVEKYGRLYIDSLWFRNHFHAPAR